MSAPNVDARGHAASLRHSVPMPRSACFAFLLHHDAEHAVNPPLLLHPHAHTPPTQHPASAHEVRRPGDLRGMTESAARAGLRATRRDICKTRRGTAWHFRGPSSGVSATVVDLAATVVDLAQTYQFHAGTRKFIRRDEVATGRKPKVKHRAATSRLPRDTLSRCSHPYLASSPPQALSQQLSSRLSCIRWGSTWAKRHLASSFTAAASLSAWQGTRLVDCCPSCAQAVALRVGAGCSYHAARHASSKNWQQPVCDRVTTVKTAGPRASCMWGAPRHQRCLLCRAAGAA